MNTNNPNFEDIKFPKDSLRGLIREISEKVAEAHLVDSRLCYMTAISVISGAIGKNYKVSNGSPHGSTNLNLFFLLSAPTSGGKGIVMKKIMKPFFDWEADRDRKFREELPKIKTELQLLKREKERNLKENCNDIHEHGAYLKNSLSDTQEKIERISDDEKNIRQPRPILIDNASSEAMAIAIEQAKGTLYSTSSEASDLIDISKGRYSDKGSDYNLLLKAFSGDRAEFRRVNRETVKILDPCLSLIWIAQPTVVNELIHDKSASEQGLLGRFLYLKGIPIMEEEELEPIKIPKELEELWGEKVKSILSQRDKSEPQEIKCSTEAREVFLDFHNKVKKQCLEELAGFANELGKSREIAIRLAGVLAIAEDENSDPKSITAELAKRAVSIVEYCHNELIQELRLHKQITTAQSSERIIKIFEQKNQSDSLTLRVMEKNHGISEHTIDEVVAAFPDKFEVKTIMPNSRGGRPSKVLRLKNTPQAA